MFSLLSFATAQALVRAASGGVWIGQAQDGGATSALGVQSNNTTCTVMPLPFLI